MELDKLLVLTGGITAIAFVYWFFLMKKEEAVAASDSIDILVLFCRTCLSAAI